MHTLHVYDCRSVLTQEFFDLLFAMAVHDDSCSSLMAFEIIMILFRDKCDETILLPSVEFFRKSVIIDSEHRCITHYCDLISHLLSMNPNALQIYELSEPLLQLCAKVLLKQEDELRTESSEFYAASILSILLESDPSINANELYEQAMAHPLHVQTRMTIIAAFYLFRNLSLNPEILHKYWFHNTFDCSINFHKNLFIKKSASTDITA